MSVSLQKAISSKSHFMFSRETLIIPELQLDPDVPKASCMQCVKLHWNVYLSSVFKVHVLDMCEHALKLSTHVWRHFYLFVFKIFQQFPVWPRLKQRASHLSLKQPATEELMIDCINPNHHSTTAVLYGGLADLSWPNKSRPKSFDDISFILKVYFLKK